MEIYITGSVIAFILKMMEEIIVFNGYSHELVGKILFLILALIGSWLMVFVLFINYLMEKDLIDYELKRYFKISRC